MSLEQLEEKLLKEIVEILTCPITKKLIQKPVYYIVDNKPQFFEEEAIKNWQKEKGTCPLTQKDIHDIRLLTDSDTKDLLKRMVDNHLFSLTGELRPFSELQQENGFKEFMSELMKKQFLSAVKRNDLDKVKLFVEAAKEYLEIKDKDGWTALHYAARRGYLDMAKYLLEAGAPTASETLYHKTPLWWAINGNHLEIVRYLFTAGAADNLNHLLHLAVELKLPNNLSGEEEIKRWHDDRKAIVDLLISKGADVNAIDSRGCTPVHTAVSIFNNEALIEQLISHGADVNIRNKEGQTPLHYASKVKSNEAAVQWLLAAGADVSIKNNKEETPIKAAITEYYRESWLKTRFFLELAQRTPDVKPIYCLPAAHTNQSKYALLKKQVIDKNAIVLIEENGNYKIGFNENGNYAEILIPSDSVMKKFLQNAISASTLESSYGNELNAEQAAKKIASLINATQLAVQFLKLHVDLVNSSLKNTDNETKEKLIQIHLTNIGLTGIPKNLQIYAELIKINLSGANLSSMQLEGANFAGGNLTNADLTGTDLSKTNLTGANLTNANLIDANLIEANLTGAVLTNAKLINADLMNVNLTKANLTGANLTKTDLTGANLTSANLTNANLTGADLTDVNLTNATIDKRQLLEASSLREIILDRNTLKVNNYTNDDLIALKKKIVTSYTTFFKKCNDFNQIVTMLHTIKTNQQHILKLERHSLFSEYGATNSYAEVMTAGRNKLLELAKKEVFDETLPDAAKLHDVFQEKFFGVTGYIKSFFPCTKTQEDQTNPLMILLNKGQGKVQPLGKESSYQPNPESFGIESGEGKGYHPSQFQK
jgi:uncharacterized protein YjbI with pentapeptide repeats